MLFKNINEVKEHTEVGAVTFSALSKSIRVAEADIIVPVLGNTLYNSLTSAYQSSPQIALADKYKNLLPYVQDCLAPYAIYVYVPKAEVLLTDAGAQRVETATNKSAFQYQVTNQRAQLYDEAIKMQELLLSFLEKNIDDYSEWTDSAEFKKYRNLFIQSAAEFNALYATASPCRNYYFMRSVMVDVENLYIKKSITAELFDAIKTKAKTTAPAFTDEEKILIDLLKHAIAHYTIAKALPRLAVSITEHGITVSSNTQTGNDALSKKQTAADNQLSQLQRDAESTAAEWLSQACDYILANASDAVFPEWYTIYQQQQQQQNQQTSASPCSSPNEILSSVYTP